MWTCKQSYIVIIISCVSEQNLITRLRIYVSFLAFRYGTRKRKHLSASLSCWLEYIVRQDRAGCPSHCQVTLSQIHDQRCYSNKGRRLCEQLRLMTSQLASRDYAVTDSDAALLERLRQGDAAAFEGLFLRHYGQVYRVLYHLVGSREEAEDLAQETFLALYDQPPATGVGVVLVAWLCRVALNRGYNALRGQRRTQQRLERIAEPPAQIDPQA